MIILIWTVHVSRVQFQWAEKAAAQEVGGREGRLVWDPSAANPVTPAAAAACYFYLSPHRPGGEGKEFMNSNPTRKLLKKERRKVKLK